MKKSSLMAVPNNAKKDALTRIFGRLLLYGRQQAKRNKGNDYCGGKETSGRKYKLKVI
jgi:hypothetical protein